MKTKGEEMLTTIHKGKDKRPKRVGSWREEGEGVARRGTGELVTCGWVYEGRPTSKTQPSVTPPGTARRGCLIVTKQPQFDLQRRSALRMTPRNVTHRSATHS